MGQMNSQRFEREKFIELMLYFSKRGLDGASEVGATKLNKLLFFADFRAFHKLGRPITGARYQKLEWGPAPRALVPVRNELVDAGAAKLRDPEDWNVILEPLREPDMSLFSADELFIIEEVFSEISKLSATAVSEYSHEEAPGWEAADENEDIPYATARIGTKRPPERVFEFFRQLHGISVST